MLYPTRCVLNFSFFFSPFPLSALCLPLIHPQSKKQNGRVTHLLILLILRRPSTWRRIWPPTLLLLLPTLASRAFSPIGPHGTLVSAPVHVGDWTGGAAVAHAAFTVLEGDGGLFGHALAMMASESRYAAAGRCRKWLLCVVSRGWSDRTGTSYGEDRHSLFRCWWSRASTCFTGCKPDGGRCFPFSLGTYGRVGWARLRMRSGDHSRGLCSVTKSRGYGWVYRKK